MKKQNLISLEIYCQHCEIEPSFIHELEEYGLLEFIQLEERLFIHEDQLSELEKILRMHRDLEINLAGIDTIFHLMKKMEDMQHRMRYLEAKLRLYE